MLRSSIRLKCYEVFFSSFLNVYICTSRMQHNHSISQWCPRLIGNFQLIVNGFTEFRKIELLLQNLFF